METTKVFGDLLALYLDPAVRYIVAKGGSRSSKTWSILQLLHLIAAKSRTPRVLSVVSETFPHLRRGCIRDFQTMLNEDGTYRPQAWHDTDKVYRYPKAKLEFFSADQPSKVQGPARDILYVNEAINIPYETFRQLAVRTSGKIILDYNPAYSFWVDTEILPRPDAALHHSTYKDNHKLSPAIVAEIESYRTRDPEWFNVYGLGLTGRLEGLIVKNWDVVDGLPTTYKRRWIGVDFGWTSPTAIMLVVEGEGGEVWIDEIAYSPNLDNADIARIIKEAGLSGVEVIADAAEPKSIKELRTLGINAVKTDNKDIPLGIQVMNRYQKHYTARSVNSIEENRKYRYGVDAFGKYTGSPVDQFNHAKDAERYVFLNRLSKISSGFDITIGTAIRR